MTKMQRIKKVLLAALMLLCCVVLLKLPDEGVFIVALILSSSLLVYGVRSLLYYFTMARHMVGGKSILFRGIIVTDFAVFCLSMVDDPNIFIILYLLGVHGYAGAMDVLRAMEARRFHAPAWRRSMAFGLGNLAIAGFAVVAGFFLHSTRDLVYLYTACLFYSACAQLAAVFRKTAIVYVQ